MHAEADRGAYMRTLMYAEMHVCADVTEAHASATL